ncbi:LysR family transcriptional regulator [Saccharopolyspora shandongensis]|uniref:LysR family transcriptional regulator n=1 Tax=Saccharopolyspora shandongensis TaxID=418495 RepID=UPI0033E5B10E
MREVAERGTITAAAKALGYTQSAVSRQVAALEQAVGSRLFDRHPGGVRLTTAGRSLLRHAVVAWTRSTRPAGSCGEPRPRVAASASVSSPPPEL